MFEHEYDPYEEARYEARYEAQDARYEAQYKSAREDLKALAREELGEEATKEEIDELALEIFQDNLDSYVDTCNCSDPECPCGGIKRGAF